MSARRRRPPAEPAPASGAPVWPDGYQGTVPDDGPAGSRPVTTAARLGLVQYNFWFAHVRQREWGVTDPDAPVGAVLQ